MRLPMNCKFCHKPVSYDDQNKRFYEVDSNQLHVENCELRRQFFKEQAARRSENKRQTRSH